MHSSKRGNQVPKPLRRWAVRKRAMTFEPPQTDLSRMNALWGLGFV
jgi:hypothetical protein